MKVQAKSVIVWNICVINENKSAICSISNINYNHILYVPFSLFIPLRSNQIICFTLITRLHVLRSVIHWHISSRSFMICFDFTIRQYSFVHHSVNIMLKMVLRKNHNFQIWIKKITTEALALEFLRPALSLAYSTYPDT